MTKRTWLLQSIATFGLVSMLAVPTTVFAQNLEIGVAAAVNPDAESTPPSRETRVLNVGHNVFHNEVIRTSAKGQAQMLFADQSALTIGPNSEVVLDEFLYDPETKTGKIALSATKGLFRLVGGRISKTTPVTLRTPTATIGIRGGIAFVGVQPTGATNATFLFGHSMSVSNENGTQVARRPGYEINVSAANAAPSTPVPASAQALSGALSGLEGSAESTSEDAPQDEDVAAASDDSAVSNETADEGSETAQDGTDVSTGGTQDPSSSSSITLSNFSGRYKTTPSTGTSTGTSDETSTKNISFSGGSAASDFTATLGSDTWKTTVSTGSFSFGSSGTSSPFGPVQGTGFLSSDQEFLFYEVTEDNFAGERALLWGGVPFSGTVPTTGVKFFSLQDDFALNSTQAFASNAAGGSLTPFASESVADSAIIFGSGDDGSTTLASGAQRAFLHGSASGKFNTTDDATVITIIVGQVLTDSNGKPFIQGAGGGTARLSETALPRVISGEASTANDALGNSFFGNTDYFVIEAQNVNSSGTKLGTADGVEDLFAGTTTTFFPNAIALPATDTISTRTTRSMYGYTGGSIERITTAGSRSSAELFQNKTSNPFDVFVFTNASLNKVSAGFDGTQSFNSIDDFTVDLGDLDPAFELSTTTTGDGAFIDNFTFGAIDASPISGQPASVSGQTVSDADLYMLRMNASDFPSTVLESGKTLCECTFLTWGYWGGEIDIGSNDDVVHLASWVAGKIPDLSAITALSGSATYNGHVSATVKEISGSTTSIFTELGTWAYTFNFESPSSSSGTISNFDGGTYTIGGSTLASADDPDTTNVTETANKFSGSLTGASGEAVGRSGSFLGSFMQNGSSNPSAGMGGHLAVSGTNYSASGVFVAQK